MKNSKKIVAALVAVILAVVGVFAACSKSADNGGDTEKKEDSSVKIGFIFLHDENSTYDLNFINAAKEACEKAGVEYVLKTNVPEGNECYEAAADLVDQGCNVVFADSFGHEDYMIKAAKEFTDVEFCHATGTKAHTEKLANYHNAFASIYEGRYLAGVAAGLKLNEIKEAKKLKGDVPKMGYVGAFTYAEVVSGYTSFYLGAKSVCPDVVMDVQFTGSWYDETAEKEAAQALINAGADLISQHADSMGAPTACENAGIPDVSYNGSTVKACPNTFIVSSRINWAPYFEHIIDCVQNNKEIEADWTGTIETGSVELTEVNEKAAAKDTQAKLDEVKKGLEDGSIKVFDTKNFTVTVDAKKQLNAKATVDKNGVLTGYQADVDTDEAFAGDTEVVKDGAFSESEFRSAPYFDINIDGITLLNTKF
ncbi:MAG: BMP family ABC transporter substrate-binding protein [Eubacterium sp.]|nr:BMP family ABC transporter substrate-binding protein [Eubacterium sp.]MBR1532204.1 BMP family ABC transporter substrate-binding protein [Eubacterium sp.]MBR2277846.1 BMP family ABC transporter substrate-binding protein [Eubacterium sp.]